MFKRNNILQQNSTIFVILYELTAKSFFMSSTHARSFDASLEPDSRDKGHSPDKPEDKDAKSSQQIDRIEEYLGELYGYKLWNPRFLQLIVWALGLALMGYCGWTVIQFFKKPKAVNPVYTKIEGIKRLGELHLVKQYYESIIPITRKKEKEKGLIIKRTLVDQQLQFLLLAPVEVSGYVDFSKLKLTVEKDSLIKIVIPEAQISKVYLDFAKTEEYLVEGKFRIFGKYLENINHEKAYYDIARGINETKMRIRERAKVNDIKKETLLKAQIFLRNFIGTMGYRVEFVLPQKTPPAVKDSTENKAIVSPDNSSSS